MENTVLAFYKMIQELCFSYIQHRDKDLDSHLNTNAHGSHKHSAQNVGITQSLINRSSTDV